MPKIPVSNIQSAPSGFGQAVAAKPVNSGSDIIGEMGGTLNKIGQQLQKKGNEAELIDWQERYNSTLNNKRDEIKVNQNKMDDKGDYEYESRDMAGNPIKAYRNISQDLDELSAAEDELKKEGNTITYSNKAKSHYGNVTGRHSDRAKFGVEMSMLKKKAKKSFDGMILNMDYASEKMKSGEPDPVETEKLLQRLDQSVSLFGEDQVKNTKRSSVESMIANATRGIAQHGDGRYADTIKVLKANATPAQKLRLEQGVEKAATQYRVNTMNNAIEGFKKYKSALKDPNAADMAVSTAPTIAKGLLDVKPEGEFAPSKAVFRAQAVDMTADTIYREASATSNFYASTPDGNINGQALKILGSEADEMVKSMKLKGPEAAKFKSEIIAKAKSKFFQAKFDPALMIEADKNIAARFAEGDMEAGFQSMDDLYGEAGVSPSKRSYFHPQVTDMMSEQLKVIKDEGSNYGPRVNQLFNSAGKYRDTMVSNLIESGDAEPATILLDKMNAGFSSRLGSALHVITQEKGGYNSNALKELAGISMADFKQQIGSKMESSDIALPRQFTNGTNNRAYNRGIRQSIEALAYTNLERTGGDSGDAIELAIKEFGENVATFANENDADAFILPRELVKDKASFNAVKDVISSPSVALEGILAKYNDAVDINAMKKIYEQNDQTNSNEYIELTRMGNMKDKMEMTQRFVEVFGDKVIIKNNPERQNEAVLQFRSRTLDHTLKFESGGQTLSVDEMKILAPIGERKKTIAKVDDLNSYIKNLEKNIAGKASGATDTIYLKMDLNNAKRRQRQAQERLKVLAKTLGDN